MRRNRLDKGYWLDTLMSEIEREESEPEIEVDLSHSPSPIKELWHKFAHRNRL